MNILQQFYNSSFGDYDVMRINRALTEQHNEWKESGNYEREDWKDKHRIWTIEPLQEITP